MNIKEKKFLKIALQALALVALVAFTFYLSRLASESELVRDTVSRLGYVGIFIVSLISGFNLAVPVPAIAFLPVFVASGFSFWPIIVVVTLGMTAGDSIGYLLGDTGRKLIKLEGRENKVVSYLERFREKHRLFPYILLLLYSSFAPFPNEAIVIPMSFMGYRFVYTIPIVFVGNFIFNAVAGGALAGLYAII